MTLDKLIYKLRKTSIKELHNMDTPNFIKLLKSIIEQLTAFKMAKQELWTYEKALKLACSEIVMHRICDNDHYYGEDTEDVIEEYLDKVAEGKE